MACFTLHWKFSTLIGISQLKKLDLSSHQDRSGNLVYYTISYLGGILPQHTCMLPKHTIDFEALAKQLEVGVPLQKTAARLLKYPWYFEQAAN